MGCCDLHEVSIILDEMSQGPYMTHLSIAGLALLMNPEAIKTGHVAIGIS